MTTPQALHHSLLRPCVLHILRAAGYHSTRPSVLDTLTDLAARYMLLLASSAAAHASLNHDEFEISIEDVRMAMQECGVLAPELLLEDEQSEEEEDTRGVDGFIEWAKGADNREIGRIALEGGEAGKEDYLTALKKKSSKVDDDSKYHATVLGNPTGPRAIKVEGSDITSLKEWATKLKELKPASADSSRRQSSALSSLGDQDMEDLEFN